MDKMQFIKRKLEQMTLEQKIGQCLVIGFVGNVITPEVRSTRMTPFMTFRRSRTRYA